MVEEKNIGFYDSTVIYFNRAFDTIDFSLLSIIIGENIQFELLYAYSVDGINYSNYLKKEEYQQIIDANFPLYLSIYCRKIVQKDLTVPNTIYQNVNVDPTIARIVLESISYDGTYYDFEKDFRYKTFYEIVNEFPKWNFYDNQQIEIDKWLKQCNAIAEMYGITCIYFKTEPDSGKTIHTLSNNVIRNVVEIKKLHIQFPNNEIPQDRFVYTDWDLPLQDEILIHVVWDKFKQAFGETIPNEKDFLYIPMLNKFFRVATVQPKTGFMGKIGWWEVFLSKYEEDETIKIPKTLAESYGGIPDFETALDELDWYQDSDSYDNVISEVNDFMGEAVKSSEKLLQENIEEKKEVTQNFTNKLMDSNFKVSLKETEKIREFYDTRLKIISINPDTSAYPITMYDCQQIDNRVVGMQYNLVDFTTKNKFSRIFDTMYKLSFNYVLDRRFTGELFDIYAETNNTETCILTVENNSNKLTIIDNIRQTSFVIDYVFDVREFYNIEIEYQKIGQYSVKIYKLENKKKTIEYQNIYLYSVLNQIINISKIHLFGGKYYVNEIVLTINDNKILSDYCNPLLQMNNF